MKKLINTLMFILIITNLNAANYTIKNEVLADTTEIKFSVVRISSDPLLGEKIDVILENKTDKYLRFTLLDGAVLGYSISPSWFETVSPGKKILSTIIIRNSELEKYGIESLDEFKFRLRIIDNDKWSSVLYNNQLVIYPTGLNEETVNYNIFKISENDLIYIDDENCLFAVINNINWNTIAGVTIPIYFENKTDRILGVSWREVSVNDCRVDAMTSREVPPGQKVLTGFHFFRSDLEKYNIKDIKKIEFSLIIDDRDTWNGPDLINEERGLYFR